jgi:hypothetical protein
VKSAFKAERENSMAEGRVRPSRRFRIFDRAVWLKSSRYTISGLVVLIIGALFIGIGLLLNTGANSAEGLLVGFGVIIVLVGIIRLLIGFINPSSPEDLETPVEVTAGELIEPDETGL